MRFIIQLLWNQKRVTRKSKKRWLPQSSAWTWRPLMSFITINLNNTTLNRIVKLKESLFSSRLRVSPRYKESELKIVRIKQVCYAKIRPMFIWWHRFEFQHRLGNLWSQKNKGYRLDQDFCDNSDELFRSRKNFTDRWIFWTLELLG